MAFSLDEKGFTVWDYIIFVVICLMSCAGGIWYSITGTRKEAIKDIRDYLLGGRAMKTFPVSMSLIASYVSGVTILGTPAEVYNYGSQYYLVVIAIFMSTFVVGTVYVPVFCTLKLSSSYEYLEVRFNRHVRGVASILFLLDEVMFLPMVVYVPALAFNQLTGINVFLVGGIMVVVCGVYTVLGGLRAVVWTDSVQTIVMFIGILVVAIAGTYSIGSILLLIITAKVSNRLRFDNWSMSPYERQTGWGAVFGSFIYWTCFNSVNQTMVQRYIALASKKKAIHALLIFCAGAILAITLCAWCGLAAWVTWYLDGCNKDGVPPVNDRLLPAFVTYVTRVRHLTGLPGIFLSGVFGAGLSSLSAVLNACALVVVEDILSGWCKLQLKSFTEGLLARLAASLLAIVSLVMLLIIEKLGGVLGVATALSAIAASATCGVFTLGMVCWWVGPRGAIMGAVAGALMAGTTSLGTQAAAAQGLREPPMNFSAECAANASYSSPHLTLDPNTIFPLFRVSYHWIAPLGFFSTLFVGALGGFFLDKKATFIKDSELFTPKIWRFLPKEFHEHTGEVRQKIESAPMTSPSHLLAVPLLSRSKIKTTEKKVEKKNEQERSDDRDPQSLLEKHDVA